MLNAKSKMVIVAVSTMVLLGGCDRNVEIASTPCDELGKVTDPAIKADLEKRCGHGGPVFKPTPPKTY
jgi:entry exclusion lipoprotein TrbK